MSRPRLTRLIAALALALSGLLVMAGPASAQPGYGGGGIIVSISTTVPGVNITVTVTGFGPGERVSVVVTRTAGGLPVVRRLTADSSGTVSFTNPVQNLRPGPHRVIVVGRSGVGTATFRTGGSAISNQAFTPTNTSSPLADSNVVIPLSILGLLLAAGGGAAVVNSRRSRSRNRV